MSGYTDISPERMREVMGSFCSGITIITADAAEGPAGFTCQSFTSLSLEPPLVAFNPARTSSSWPKIRQVGSFCVNILGADQQQLARTFAKSGIDKFAGVEHRPSEFGNPILDAALAWIDCTLYAEYDGGDHTIVVGKVEGMHALEDVDPLLFFRGAYASLEKAPTSGS
ncbi:flavin-dependent monooxygenase reductase subunit HsaB [Brevibacterium daeguense]|uniref:Flavin-dependent monooxygenase reductase subunit HsaB n=1 Tax=Brevibacterium daeguense TaxID=909936 RepID=A0ABP8EIG7_9MICO|nr:flavin reductase family protein [Brevibacterium daeguense]